MGKLRHDWGMVGTEGMLLIVAGGGGGLGGGSRGAVGVGGLQWGGVWRMGGLVGGTGGGLTAA